MTKTLDKIVQDELGLDSVAALTKGELLLHVNALAIKRMLNKAYEAGQVLGYTKAKAKDEA